MSFIVDPSVEEYAEAHTTPDGELFERLAGRDPREDDRAADDGRPDRGPVPRDARAPRGARRILELGTFTGYSSISMASALPPDGQVITCDVDPEATAIARRYMDESGYGDRIEIRLGPALETIETLDGPFDLVFIDADKENYVNYYEATLPLLADGGLMVVDNTLWSGRVADPENQEETTNAIRALNDRVRNDPRVRNVLLTVRDGMNLVMKA